MLNKFYKYVTNSGYRFLVNASLFGYPSMSDEEFLKRKFKYRLGYELNLDNPQTFNEKIQWLKLHDRRPEYTMMVDKYAVKKYVAEKIGKQYIIPTSGVWEKFDDIDFDKLPNQFVLKCTHDSGGLIICRDKSKFDIRAARKKINHCLKHNYFWVGREWCYKNVKPRIIAEKYMEDEETRELRDYKLFCFTGTPKIILIASNRNSKNADTRFDYYNMDFEHINLLWGGHGNSENYPQIPSEINKMIELASLLSRDIPFVRVDFYVVNKKIFFGELTLYPASGFSLQSPVEWDLKLGQMLQLPKGRESFYGK